VAAAHVLRFSKGGWGVQISDRIQNARCYILLCLAYETGLTVIRQDVTSNKGKYRLDETTHTAQLHQDAQTVAHNIKQFELARQRKFTEGNFTLCSPCILILIFSFCTNECIFLFSYFCFEPTNSLFYFCISVLNQRMHFFIFVFLF
jgi:hypothetical protein